MWALALGGIRAAWSFLKSPLGVGIMALALAAGALWAFGSARYSAGYKSGVASVEARITDPKVGYAVRLATAQQNLAACERARDDQTRAVQAKSAEDQKHVADAGAAVQRNVPQAQKATGIIAVIGQPIGIAATSTPGVTCLIPNDEAQKIMEIERRAMQ